MFRTRSSSLAFFVLTRTVSLSNTASACQVNFEKTLAACNEGVMYLSRITWRSLTLFPRMISRPSSAYQQTLSVPRRESSVHKCVSHTTNCVVSYCAFGAVCNISNTKERFWPHFQTPKGELKIRRTAVYFGKLWVVWKCVQTLSWVLDISSQSKLKRRRKRRNKAVENLSYLTL